MSERNDKILRFPSIARPKADYQRVKSTYSVREIKQLFGFSERTIRRWTAQGIVNAIPSDVGEECYDFRALTQFRHIRDLRNQGMTMRQAEAEIHGQMNLFAAGAGELARLLTPFEEALLLHDIGDARAAAYYKDAIREGDNVADAYCNLGIIEIETDRVKAFDSFTKALKNDPRHVEAHYDLANLYFDSGDLALARLHYEIAAGLEPSFAPLYYNLALVYYEQNDLKAACNALHSYKELAAQEDEDMAKVDELLNWLEQACEINEETRTPKNQINRRP